VSRPITGVVGSLMPELKADLARLVAIPSISGPNYPDATHASLRDAYEEVVRLCRDAGVRILDPLELPNTAPVVMGEIPAPDGAPTVLLYGHYDVVRSATLQCSDVHEDVRLGVRRTTPVESRRPARSPVLHAGRDGDCRAVRDVG
jgi:hypothetical protein